TQPPKPLVGYRLWLTGRILGLFEDEHRVAEWGVDHAGPRNHRHLMLLVRENLDVREHARREPAIRVVQGRSETHVSRGDVDLRVDHADLPLPARAGKDVKLDPHALPYLDVGQRLLRQGKLDVDRRHRLQRGDHGARREDLAKLDLPYGYPAIEWSTDRLFRNGRFEVGNGGGGLRGARRSGVQVGRRIGAGFAKLSRPGQGDLGEVFVSASGR